ncbi:NAD kinase [Ornithobacterium rhinotracheale]|uniref:NAD kinase n=1 Tax=Ornithobacterium rhinotracheale TaxID=28251 RepID=UPI00129D17D2|nr:NAD kinase [Ornithobacterium rhinotracheale]MRJ10289.1 NAD kinase [Ornithobacterium rhinotracheale]
MSDLKIALYGKHTTSTHLGDLIPAFLAKIRQRGAAIQVEREFYQVLKNIKGLSLNGVEVFSTHEELWQDLDYFFTFGGDGTILSAVTYVRDMQIPIVGVNTGRLGYLASIHKNDLIPNFDAIFAKDYNISERSLLEVSLSDGSPLECPFALNELSVMRKETTSMISVDAYINGELLNSFWADGLIIATPTGSTGYSLSCNGPIISPENHNFVITPIAPHNLNVRPIVIPDKEHLRLKVKSRVSHYSLSLDSRLASLKTTTEILVKRAHFLVKIVELKHNSYLETLRQKLFWGADSRNA